ncbi:MAG: zinc ribbon domain-containing protein [Planctomycetota bacterium]
MVTKLGALLNLQSIEHQIAKVRQRLNARRRAVKAQEKRIAEVQEQLEQLQETIQQKRRSSDEYDLDLQSREEKVAKLRSQLQTAKTNKEYAALLTEINTLKADNAKIEEESLKFLSAIDELNSRADELKQKLAEENQKLAEIQASTQEEIDRLNGMMEQLQAKRAEATKELDDDTLAQFERVAENFQGEAMVPIEVHGRKAPYTYICGGCFMSLSPEHANALRTHDEIRQCDSCGRILYMEEKAKS